MIQYVDSHCHVGGAEYNSDRAEVIQRAQAAGVRHLLMICSGINRPDLNSVVQLAAPVDGAYAAAGIHPHDATEFLAGDFSELRKMAGHPKFIAVGEIGLDYHYAHSSPSDQQQMFVRQLELAREVRLPVIIHSREAWADLRRLIDEHWRTSGLGGILHCFTGSCEDAFPLIDCGFMVSFAGILTYKNAQQVRSVAQAIPADRLLTETDSPYLAPVPYRGRRNEPAFVLEVLRQLAALRGVGEEEMAAQVLDNFCRFFSIPDRSQMSVRE